MDIKSITDLTRLLAEQRTDHFPRFYYRGEPATPTPLVPRLLRADTRESLAKSHGNDPLRVQDRLLERFRRYVDLSGGSTRRLSELNFGEALCVGQHHGLPTLLLDWTLDPLAALFFAVSSSVIRNALRHTFQVHEGSIFGGVDDYARYLAGGGL